jgi:hypothetical protein
MVHMLGLGDIRSIGSWAMERLACFALPRMRGAQCSKRYVMDSPVTLGDL